MNRNENSNGNGDSNNSYDVRQLVAFQIGSEGFCVDINKVREINRLVEITQIPESPDFIEGVINLRGEIIPIIDMRKRFRMKTRGEYDKDTRIMVIDTDGSMVGFIVDAVREVLRLSEKNIDPPPDLVTAEIDRKYIEGVATVNNRLLIVLDSDLIFAQQELHSLEGVGHEAAA